MTLKGFPVGLVVQNLPANAGDAGSDPELGRSPEEGRQPIPVFLPGKPHGQRSLVDRSPWGHKGVRRASVAVATWTLEHRVNSCGTWA